MAPVAFAVAIIPGLARFIVMLSAHAAAFGVGITVVGGSILVAPSCATTGCIVPGGPTGICGIESGRSAPLLGGPPGVELHVVVEELPIGVTGAVFPVVVMTTGVGIVPNGAAVPIATADVIVVDKVVIVDDDVIVFATGVEVLLKTVDDGGTGTAVKEGGGRGGTAGGGGAGTFEPKKTLANDVSGCWENVNGAIAGAIGLPVVGVKELDGSAVIVGAAEADGIVPVVPTIVDMEVTGTEGAPSAI
jgi:hypothetical protein